jgi:hypothetical protein
MIKVIEHLPSKHEALSSNSRIAKALKKNKLLCQAAFLQVACL